MTNTTQSTKARWHRKASATGTLIGNHQVKGVDPKTRKNAHSKSKTDSIFEGRNKEPIRTVEVYKEAMRAAFLGNRKSLGKNRRRRTRTI